MLADFMEAENGIVVNLHIQSIDHNEAIKMCIRDRKMTARCTPCCYPVADPVAG